MGTLYGKVSHHSKAAFCCEAICPPEKWPSVRVRLYVSLSEFGSGRYAHCARVHSRGAASLLLRIGPSSISRSKYTEFRRCLLDTSSLSTAAEAHANVNPLTRYS